MLLTKQVRVEVSGPAQSRYKKLGYEIPKVRDSKGRMNTPRGAKILVKTKDLPHGSHAKVKVKCDYCGVIKYIEYKEYLHHHDEVLGDCCHKCEKIKYLHTLQEKYGVNNSFDIPGIQEKIKKANLEKYGYEWHMQRPEYQKHYEETMREKYGFSRALQVPQFKEKQLISWAKANKTPTSAPQKAVFDMLQLLYGKNNCELELPCERCMLDCVLQLNDVKIDIEYDGKFWHQLTVQKDRRRDNFVRSCGYKILRIKGNKKDTLPSLECLYSITQLLINSSLTYFEIIM